MRTADRDSYLSGLAGTSYSILPGLTFLGTFDVASVTMYPTQVIPALKTIAGAAIPIPLVLSQTDLDKTSSFYFGAAQCIVIGGQGATLFSSVVPKFNCLTECRNRALNHAGRRCIWSGANIKGLCRIVFPPCEVLSCPKICLEALVLVQGTASGLQTSDSGVVQSNCKSHHAKNAAKALPPCPRHRENPGV